MLKVIGVLALLTVAWLSLSPVPLPSRELQNLFRPYEHVVMFGALTLICLAVWPRRRGLVIGLLLLLAALMEIVQELLPVRAFQWDDLFANLAGVTAGAFGFYILLWIWGQGGKQT